MIRTKHREKDYFIVVSTNEEENKKLYNFLKEEKIGASVTIQDGKFFVEFRKPLTEEQKKKIERI